MVIPVPVTIALLRQALMDAWIRGDDGEMIASLTQQLRAALDERR